MRYALVFVGLAATSQIAFASRWDDPLDPVAIITDAIAQKRRPILRVFHDLQRHGAWQFYDDAEPLNAPVVIPKEQLLVLDPSLKEIKDLPLGWEAVRKDKGSPWIRRKLEQ